MSEELRSIYLDAQAVAESDPNTALFKLRWCAETIAEKIGTQRSIEWPQGLRFELFIDELSRQNAISADVADKLDKTRIVANRAIHEMRGTKSEANLVLGYIRDLSSVAFPSVNLSDARANSKQTAAAGKQSLRIKIDAMHQGSRTSRKRYYPRPLGMVERFSPGCLAVLVIIVLLPTYVIFGIDASTPAEAKGRFDKALSLGNDKFNSRDFEEAAEAYESATELIPTNALAHRSLGGALFELKEYEKSEKEFSSAIMLGEWDRYTVLMYGITLHKQGKYNASIGIYREMMRIDPGYCYIYPNIAISMFKKGLFAEAIYFASDPRACEGSRDFVLSTRASAFAALNQWDRAVVDLNILVQAYPDDSDIRDRLGEAYEGLGDMGSARSQRSIADDIRWRNVGGVGSFLTWLFN